MAFLMSQDNVVLPKLFLLDVGSMYPEGGLL